MGIGDLFSESSTSAQRKERRQRRQTPGKMLSPAHVILHAAFCNAIARLPAQTPIALRVHLIDRFGKTQIDRVFRVERGDETESVVEFDSAFGIYSLDVEAPKYRCSASDYLFFIAGFDRSVTEKLSDSPSAAAKTGHSRGQRAAVVSLRSTDLRALR